MSTSTVTTTEVVNPSIYVVDLEHGVHTLAEDGITKVFTTTSKEIKAFGSERTLFDFFAEVVDSQYEEKIMRLKGVRKYEFGGTVISYTFNVVEGLPSLVEIGRDELPIV